MFNGMLCQFDLVFGAAKVRSTSAFRFADVIKVTLACLCMPVYLQALVQTKASSTDFGTPVCASEALETQLKHNTQLQHTEPTLKELARSTKSIAGQVRFGLGLFNALGKAAIANKILQQRPAN